ncbi:YceI family protein [Stenotrophomonas sp. 278]|uniref:YceI family protein n=1 Tax=Stenotrophomonas sp. 278 TaxID=2479851 RepID=UPI000F66732F|nr:YceI family protein [Stenotrophomonas sp. 278]RRU25691.1 polyisoprenoid-binding protein [Stenotrophomonas sp. 278]
MPVRLTLALLLAAAPIAALAAPQTWRLDPVHTRVLFAVEHAGFSQALGTVSGSEGQLLFDPDDWTGARLTVSVPLQRLDLGDAKWNKAVMAGNLLDTDRHPDARFVSTRVEPVDASHARVFGQLTLRGVTQDVELAVTVNAVKRHPMPPFRRTAGFSATTTLSRKAFGVDGWPSMIGDTVELRIEAEAVRDRNADDMQDTPSDSNTGTPPAANDSDPPPSPPIMKPTP